MRAVNLIPSDSRSAVGPGAGRSGGGAYAVLAVVAGLAILALLYGKADRQISSRKAQVATLAARTQKANAEAARLTSYTSFASLREQRVQAVSQLVDSRFDWAHAFHELGRVLPSDVSISSVDGTVGAGGAASSASPAAASTSSTTAASSTAAAGGSVSSATPPGSVPSFNLSGCATSQAEVAQALERLRLIDGVKEVSLQSSSKGASAGGAGSGGCPPNDPTFTAQISFAPLPDQATTKSSTATLTSSKGGGQ